MFSKVRAKKSTADYSEGVGRLKEAVKEADAIVIGAGAGLSTAENPKAVYACINYGEAVCLKEIEKQSVCIDGDIGEVICDIK